MTKKKLRVVVDTNLFVSGTILPRGYLHDLLQAWRNDLFILVISPELLKELDEVLRRPKFMKYGLTEETINGIILLVIAKAKKAAQKQSPVTVRDPRDEKVLACALGGNVDYLVTGDEDLLTLKDDPKLKPLKIIKVKDFLTLITTPIKKQN